MLKYIVKQKEKAIIQLKKRIICASNLVYTHVDQFFSSGSDIPPLTKQEDPELRDLNYEEWSLNQGMADIILKDIKHLTGWIIPVKIKDYFGHLFRKLAFYYLYDALVEETSNEVQFAGMLYTNGRLKTDAKSIAAEHFPVTGSSRGLILFREWLAGKKLKLGRAIKAINVQRIVPFMRAQSLNRSYYIVFHYDIRNRFLQSKLTPSYFFHKRN